VDAVVDGGGGGVVRTQVFEFMGDFSNSVKWDPGVKSATPDQQGKVKVGSSFTLVTVFNGTCQILLYHR
jgi:hypothetical protein